jgi:hypothetical protein
VRKGKPKRPAVEEMLTMLPPLDLFDRRGGPGDARIVDQNVEATETVDGLLEQPVDVPRLRHVGRADRKLGTGFTAGVDRRRVDVANMDPGPGVGESLGDGPPDPGASRRHQYTQALCTRHRHLLVTQLNALAYATQHRARRS